MEIRNSEEKTMEEDDIVGNKMEIRMWTPHNKDSMREMK